MKILIVALMLCFGTILAVAKPIPLCNQGNVIELEIMPKSTIYTCVTPAAKWEVHYHNGYMLFRYKDNNDFILTWKMPLIVGAGTYTDCKEYAPVCWSFDQEWYVQTGNGIYVQGVLTTNN